MISLRFIGGSGTGRIGLGSTSLTSSAGGEKAAGGLAPFESSLTANFLYGRPALLGAGRPHSSLGGKTYCAYTLRNPKPATSLIRTAAFIVI